MFIPPCFPGPLRSKNPAAAPKNGPFKIPHNLFSQPYLYSNSSTRTSGPSRFSSICVYDRYNVIGSSSPSSITPVKALEFGKRLNGPSAKENVVGPLPSGTLVIDSTDIGRAVFAQKGGPFSVSPLRPFCSRITAAISPFSSSFIFGLP